MGGNCRSALLTSIADENAASSSIRKRLCSGSWEVPPAAFLWFTIVTSYYIKHVCVILLTLAVNQHDRTVRPSRMNHS